MSATPSLYFSTLEIENVRCFGERQVLDLTNNGQPARWSLLIGENGAGEDDPPRVPSLDASGTRGP